MRKLMVMISLTFLSVGYISAQDGVVALKTNLLYGGVTLTPNLGVEIGLGRHSTLEITAAYHPWDVNSCAADSKKLEHTLGQIEYRYWLCGKFNGHFFGVSVFGAKYDVFGHNLSMLFGCGSQNYNFEGWGVGAGVSYGYQFYLGKRWGLELTAGIGYARLFYDKYEDKTTICKLGSEVKNYFGLTKAGISLIYIIK